MGKGQGLFRRARVGAFVVGMVLAFSLPSIALAANTATFKSPVPAAGSSISNTRPTISLMGYDRYGVRASGISMWVSGVRVTPTFSYNNLGKKSFRLSYAPGAPLSLGAHRVTVKVHDLRHLNSTYSWVFTIGETVAPVTTSNAVTEYTDSATIFLFAMDNAGGSGVAHTCYTLDGFAGEGPIVYTAAAGPHTLVFWSVDVAGNVEAHHTVAFTVAKDMLTNAWHQKTTGFCATPGCHFSSLTVEHYQHADAAGALLTCFTCHDSTDPDVVATIAARSDACESCHGNTTNHIGSHTTVVPPTAVVNCIQAGCHTGNLIAIHVDAKSGTMVSCGVCHANPAHAATNDCTVCHGTSGPHSGNHAVISSESTGTATCTQAAPCHGTSVVAVHPNCATCHSPAAGGTVPTATIIAAIASGHATCEDCHGVGFFAASHGTGNASHVVGPGTCFVDTCHGTDVTLMHTKDFRGTGDTPPGCAACHAAGKTPSTNCTNCHNDLITPHDYAAAHADVQLLMATNSTACTACHGSDLKNVLPAGNAVTGVIEHDGCSCHAHGLARGKTACQGCHAGLHAPHGFAEGNISGHSTTTFGKKGMFEKYDGTENPDVVLKDSNDDTVTAEWAIPNDRVFWDKSEIGLGGFKPANAFLGDDGMGLSASSVITCEDCHTGLEAMDAGDPHGADLANAGIDPNYPVPFTSALLSGHDGGNYDGYATRSGISYRTAVTGPNDPILDGTRAVICAKCHDLYQEMEIDSNEASATTKGDARLTDAAVENGFGQLAHYDHARSQAVGGSAGRGDCVNCHVAVPHGWSRPRLLVQSIDATIVLTNEDGVTTRTVAITPDPYPYNQVRGYWNGSSWETTPGPLAGQGFITNMTQKTGFGVLPARDSSGTQVAHDMASEEITLTVGGVATGGFTFDYPEWSSSQCSASCGGTHHTIKPSGKAPRSIIE